MQCCPSGDMQLHVVLAGHVKSLFALLDLIGLAAAFILHTSCAMSLPMLTCNKMLAVGGLLAALACIIAITATLYRGLHGLELASLRRAWL